MLGTIITVRCNVGNAMRQFRDKDIVSRMLFLKVQIDAHFSTDHVYFRNSREIIDRWSGDWRLPPKWKYKSSTQFLDLSQYSNLELTDWRRGQVSMRFGPHYTITNEYGNDSHRPSPKRPTCIIIFQEREYWNILRTAVRLKSELTLILSDRNTIITFF